MPCLFLKGWPTTKPIDGNALGRLYEAVAKAVKLDVEDVEIHLDSVPWMILQSNGIQRPAPDVHIIIEWTERSFAVKQQIAKAIHEFCSFHGLGSDITFRDSPKGTFFVNGVLIGPEPELW